MDSFNPSNHTTKDIYTVCLEDGGKADCLNTNAYIAKENHTV